jgi:ketosteroid isomerase-like protein
VSEKTIADFWDAMGSNDFTFASKYLHADFEYYMPQTREYLRGRANFVALNAGYPADGKWLFSVQSIISDGISAVSDVEITDGVMEARAITFHTLHDGLILRQKEYWPDNYSAPEWRKEWVQTVDLAPF